MSFSVVDEAIVENVQIASSIVASVLGLLIHGYILYRFFYHRSSLTNYQNLIVVQSIIASICIVVLLVANQRATLYGRVILFFPFMPFDATAGLYFSGFIAAAQTFEEFLVIIFNIHRVLIFMRPNWLRKFYWFFTPVVFGYSILIGVLVIQLRQTPLVASLLPSVLVVVITITSIVCYLLISRHFRSNAGYTRNVRQMQTRFSFSILIQGVIHCFMGICIMLIVPIDLFLKFIIGKHEDAMQIVSLCYSLVNWKSYPCREIPQGKRRLEGAPLCVPKGFQGSLWKTFK
ncbi:hypothetical protein Q1695_014623 [Nippostrongylus brasiliensis]|nr:hypothetical protein Q1695_014623 [Nippostrongylus brasiliensis]